MNLTSPRTLLAAALLSAAVAAQGGTGAPQQPKTELATATVSAAAAGGRAAYDGVVEAVRQTVIAAQVSGAVVALEVEAGDVVKAGQVLLRLDARAAQQTAAAGSAQVQAARAAQEAATQDVERQRKLYADNFISRAALDHAEAQHKAALAAAQAQLATAGAAQTQSSFYVVKAPYAGVVADVAVVLGDMALPGRALVTVYDPAALRVKAAVPQSATRGLRHADVQVELPGMAAMTPAGTEVMPTVDAATHTQELRLALPAGLKGVTPGMFARAWLPTPEAAGRLYVPVRAVLRRAELTAVYVVGSDGRALLRQVRLGRAEGDRVEVLSGVSAGERVALDPQAAARAFSGAGA